MSAQSSLRAVGVGGGRAALYALVAGAHLGGFILLGLQAAPALEGGAAPVINLSLEPAPRFDAVTPPAAASTESRDAGGGAPPRPVELHVPVRETPSLFPAEITLPVAVRSPEPVQPARDERADDASRGVGRGPSGDSGDRASIDSAAGATQGGGGRTLGAAAAADTDTYAAEVLAWVERHKRHPGGARGVVTVQFQLDRRGRVHRPRLVHSSGVRALDRAALDQIVAAQPFPRPDPGVQWSLREFTMNIDYRARGAP